MFKKLFGKKDNSCKLVSPINGETIAIEEVNEANTTSQVEC